MYSYNLSGKNKYYTLYECIRGDILRGRLKAGEKLPGKRTLASELGVSVVTVQTAYEQLLAEGYVTLFPFSSWARLMRAVLSDCGEHLLERVPASGDDELKGAIADYLYRARGISVDPRYIIIGAGAEQLYGVIVQLIGRDKLYAVENPCYRKIYDAYTLSGAKCVPVPVGSDGMDIGAAEKSGAQVIHVSPAHQFPTGAVMPAANRARLISLAERRGGYVVEDDYDSEFRLYGKPLQNMYALSPERVIYVNTFSKTLAPSMRFWIVGFRSSPICWATLSRLV